MPSRIYLDKAMTREKYLNGIFSVMIRRKGIKDRIEVQLLRSGKIKMETSCTPEQIDNILPIIKEWLT